MEWKLVICAGGMDGMDEWLGDDDGGGFVERMGFSVRVYSYEYS